MAPTEMDTPCVEWSGARDEDGYGRIGHAGTRAHRQAWIDAHGPIPDGLVVCHRCDNPPCIEVDHLFLGTVAENNRDRALKGRSKGTFAAGDAHPSRQRAGCHWSSKLTEAHRDTIRARYRGGETQTALAREFNVHPATVSRICRDARREEVVA